MIDYHGEALWFTHSVICKMRIVSITLQKKTNQVFNLKIIIIKAYEVLNQAGWVQYTVFLEILYQSLYKTKGCKPY